MTDSPPRNPKRRWYQFSLRSLMVLLVVCAVVFAWIGIRMNRAAKNRERVAAFLKVVKESGGSVQDMGGMPERPTTWLDKLFDDPGDPDWRIAVLCSTDAELERLKELPNVEAVLLDESVEVSGDGLEHLKGLSKVNYLMLNDTNVTDNGLEHLTGLANLEYLMLVNTDVADTGLGHLRELTNLTFLDLDHTNVTDAGLEHLKGLSNLKCLDLRETRVTAAGIKKLQQALPNCKIIH